jgi:hypothetical protein
VITTVMLAAICHGPVVQGAEYRGVIVDEGLVEVRYGSGSCCPLSGKAFACLVHPSHQHEAVVRDHLRFYDGTSAKPRIDLVVSASPNPGMRPNPSPLPPHAELSLTATKEGFVLIPDVASACVKPTKEANEVCVSAGRWVFAGGIPRRPRAIDGPFASAHCLAHLPGNADDDPEGPVGAVLLGYLQTRPEAQSIFGVPKKPLPHVAPSSAPFFLHVPGSADEEPAGPVGAVLLG